MLGENIREDAYIYALAAHEYYWGNEGRDIINDLEYDALSHVLRVNWAEITPELKKIFISPDHLGQGATHIRLDYEIKLRAEEIYEEYLASKGA
jgi:hypothetical protein